MKNKFIFSVASFCLFFGQMIAQKAGSISINQSFAYYGLDNDMKFSINNYPCSSIVIKTNNGTVKNYGNCQFQIIPTERRDIKLTFFQTQKGDTTLIGTKVLSLKIFTDFIVRLSTYAAIKDSLIGNGALLATDGVIAHANGYCSEYFKPKIVEVRVLGVRNSEPLFDLKCKSAAFSDEIMEAFKMMKTGDKLFIFTQLKSLIDDVLQEKTISLTIK